MNNTFLDKLYKSHQACQTCPAPSDVANFFDDLLAVLFAEKNKLSHLTKKAFISRVEALKLEFEGLLQNVPQCPGDRKSLTDSFFDALPAIHELLYQDVDAMFEGDPAAKTRSEIIRTYPGFFAIAAYRIANHLLNLGIDDIPRIITEYAHGKTGIDIHPGATIGHHFCIDHGTGVVIGETTVIGNHVKVYQGVTLGALSVSKEAAQTKRHPTIGDGVVIYAGATILGGETVIGEQSIVGGNVWLTQSIPAHAKIYYQAKIHRGANEDTDVYILKAS